MKAIGKRPETTAHLSRSMMRRITKESARASNTRDSLFRRTILSIPQGKVATYGQVAAASGYPLHHRAVARLLRTSPPDSVPWHRVVGAGGEIKLRLEAALEQRFRLRMEGVTFRGRRVDIEKHQHLFRTWELD